MHMISERSKCKECPEQDNLYCETCSIINCVRVKHRFPSRTQFCSECKRTDLCRLYGLGLCYECYLVKTNTTKPEKKCSKCNLKFLLLSEKEEENICNRCVFTLKAKAYHKLGYNCVICKDNMAYRYTQWRGKTICSNCKDKLRGIENVRRDICDVCFKNKTFTDELKRICKECNTKQSEDHTKKRQRLEVIMCLRCGDDLKEQNNGTGICDDCCNHIS